VPTVALVGYTNAGKTTLFNLLTREKAQTSNALFVTLDPLVRRVRLPDRRELLVSDTVGFIDRLPHSLVAAFRATLEEVAEADLLLHVIDAGVRDRERHMAAVRRVLEEVGAGEVPVIEVFNKCDTIDEAEQRRLQQQYPASVCISALFGDGRGDLLDTIASRVALDTRPVVLHFRSSSETDRQRIALLYRHARVRAHTTSDGHITIEAEVPRRLLDRLVPERTDEP
jgi:GTP-binding protein HflX